MKKQRPTIPIFEWKLSVNLEATRDIQNQEGTPAFGCECEWCQNWKACYTEILPNDLLQQLLRVGVQLEHPTDLYESGSNDKTLSIRAIYHAVGNILNGPNQWNDNDMGKMLMYQTIRKKPYLSLVVLPQSQSHCPAPLLEGNASSELICVDFRLEVPSKFCKTNHVHKHA